MNLTNTIIKNFYKEEKFSIICIIILSIIINFFKINILSYISSNIIKSIENNNKKYAFQYYNYFFIGCIIFIILFYIFKYLQFKISFKIRYWTRLFLIDNVLSNNSENLQNLNFTKLNSPFYMMSNEFENISSVFFNSIIPNLTLILIIFIFFIYINVKVGLIFLFGNILLLFYLWHEFNIIYNKYKNIEETIIHSQSIITEIFNNIYKIIFRGTKNNELSKYKTSIDDLCKKNDICYKYINYVILISNIIIYGVILLIIFYLIYLYTNKEITSVIFITFLTILLLYRDIMLIDLQRIPRFIEFYARNELSTKLFNINLFSNPNKNKVLNNKLKFNSLEFKNIDFHYDKNNKNNKNNKTEKIFNNFNLKIDIEDKIIGIIGISSKGKSTLSKLMLKIYPYEGSILIDNINIQNICTKYLRKNIIYVDQSGNLFDRKIIDNIFYGMHNSKNPTIISKNFLDKIMKYPKIKKLYDNINFEEKNAGFNGSNLSGGQRQVINIINGLITPSIITILDEPTNALDPELKKEVLQLIKDFKKYNKCIIIITHDKDVYTILDEKIEI